MSVIRTCRTVRTCGMTAIAELLSLIIYDLQAIKKNFIDNSKKSFRHAELVSASPAKIHLTRRLRAWIVSVVEL